MMSFQLRPPTKIRGLKKCSFKDQTNGFAKGKKKPETLHSQLILLFLSRFTAAADRDRDGRSTTSRVPLLAHVRPRPYPPPSSSKSNFPDIRN